MDDDAHVAVGWLRPTNGHAPLHLVQRCMAAGLEREEMDLGCLGRMNTIKDGILRIGGRMSKLYECKFACENIVKPVHLCGSQ